jgi:hypothetical protein
MTMTKLSDPLVEACAIARLIEARALTISGFAQNISKTPEPMEVKPEEWLIFALSLETLLDELKEEIWTFTSKAKYGT